MAKVFESRPHQDPLAEKEINEINHIDRAEEAYTYESGLTPEQERKIMYGNFTPTPAWSLS